MSRARSDIMLSSDLEDSVRTTAMRDAATWRYRHEHGLLVTRIASTGLLLGAALFAIVAAPVVARAQWSTAYEQFYLPGKFNWTFRTSYPAADRLFNAFDYGHAILYERLYNDAHAPTSELEEKEYDFITKKLLVSPPRLPLEEAAIEVNYAKIAPEAKMMFDWAHLLHRQVYDVLASENMSQQEKDAKIAELVAYYKTRPDLAFSSMPKNMDLMEGQPYSLAFRHAYPKFNGLIWGYHWLQVGLYEPMMTGSTQEERQAGVAAAVTRFRQMLENAPEHMPRVMPMTAAIAPTFAKRYQEAAIIFDNLHAMHDVVSDILTNDKVPHQGKRAAILEAASWYRDATTFLMPISEWATMGEMMGIENMGGPAVGLLAGWATPTVARGSSMADAMKGMAGMKHGADTSGTSAMASMPGMSHAAAPDSAAGKSEMAAMPGMTHAAPNTSTMGMSQMMQMQDRMMRDPVIRQRVMADTSLRRMMQSMDTTHGGMAGMDMSGKAAHADTSAATPAATQARKSTSARKKKGTPAKAKTPVKEPIAKPAPMDHSKMKGMPNMPGMRP